MRYLARKSLIFSPNLQFSNSIRTDFLREFLSRKRSSNSLRLFSMADEVTYLGARNPSQLNKRFICIAIYIYNPPFFLELEVTVNSQDIFLARLGLGSWTCSNGLPAWCSQCEWDGAEFLPRAGMRTDMTWSSENSTWERLIRRNNQDVCLSSDLPSNHASILKPIRVKISFAESFRKKSNWVTFKCTDTDSWLPKRTLEFDRVPWFQFSNLWGYWLVCYWVFFFF